jgi:crooked neck
MRLHFNCNHYAVLTLSFIFRYAELEQQLGETERARQLFEVGVEQPILDLPEALWKAYIDFEISEANTVNVRSLYNRLLDRTTHPKVFVSFAQFEASIGDVESARAVYVRGDAQFKGNASAKEERLLVLEAWLLFEQQHGDAASVASVEAKMPKQVCFTSVPDMELCLLLRVFDDADILCVCVLQLKKKRPIIGEDGTEDGWEEYASLQLLHLLICSLLFLSRSCFVHCCSTSVLPTCLFC